MNALVVVPVLLLLAQLLWLGLSRQAVVLSLLLERALLRQGRL